MSLALKFSALSISRIPTRLSVSKKPPLPYGMCTNLFSTDKVPETNPFKDAIFIEFCIKNENNSNLPPHLHPKYLSKKVVDRIERTKAATSIKEKDERWSNMRAIVANLSDRIDNINVHIEKYNKDKHSKANRRILKFKRKKLMRYVKRIDFSLYEELKEKYSLTEGDILIDRYTWHRRKMLVDAAKAEKKAKLKATQQARGIKL